MLKKKHRRDRDREGALDRSGSSKLNRDAEFAGASRVAGAILGGAEEGLHSKRPKITVGPPIPRVTVQVGNLVVARDTCENLQGRRENSPQI